MANSSAPLSDEFPPRGSGIAGRIEGPPTATWGHPWELSPAWNWQPGKVLLGQWGDRLLGDPDQKEVKRLGDDRHLVTIAGSRAGKSRTVLKPNLLRYPGSVIVIDPKGELARETLRHRHEVLGQQVVVLDPFQTSGWESNSYNPLDELDPSNETFTDDVDQIADALIIEGKGEPHWTDSAKALVTAIILYVYATGGEISLSRVRRILLGAEGFLGNARSDPDDLTGLYQKMSRIEAFGGLIARHGRSFLERDSREASSVASTARAQLGFLDSEPLIPVLQSSPLRLSQLKSQPTTIYLCLPAARLGTHKRWLRLMVTLALIALEADKTKPKHPVLLILEEFAALDHMKPIERAAGFMAGFDVRMWSVLQDLSQLKAVYSQSWETFLGNAGIIQAFGNVDLFTTDHLSKMLGPTVVLERQDTRASGSGMDHGDIGVKEQPRNVRLLEPFEITRWFARPTGRQLIISPGRPPIYMERYHDGEAV